MFLLSKKSLPMRLALLQLNATIGAFDANRTKLEAVYKDAVSKGAELVLAPELFLCGYLPAICSCATTSSRADLSASTRSQNRSATSRSSPATSTVIPCAPDVRCATPPPSSSTARSRIA